MNTHQATYETALERFESNAAKRETRQLVYTVGAVGVGVALLGAFIALVTLSAPAPIVIQTVPPVAQVPAEVHAAPQALPAAAEPAVPGAEKRPDG